MDREVLASVEHLGQCTQANVTEGRADYTCLTLLQGEAVGRGPESDHLLPRRYLDRLVQGSLGHSGGTGGHRTQPGGSP